MRPFLPLLLLALVTPALAQAPSQPLDKTQTILEQERLFWANYTTGNVVGLNQQLLPEFTSVEQMIWSREQVLSFVKVFTTKCSLAPVKILDPHVDFIAPDTATLVYHATESPTCNGHTLSGDTNITTVWLLRPGFDGKPRWQMHLHTEYAVPAPEPSPHPSPSTYSN